MGLGEVSLGFLPPMLRAAEVSGVNVPHMLARHNILSTELEKPEQWLSISRYMRIGHDLVAKSGNLALGLDAGHCCKLQGLGLVGPLMMTAPTLYDALKCLVDYEALYSSCLQGKSRLYQDGKNFALQFYSIKPYNEYNHFIVDFILSHWYHLCALCTGLHNHVQRVEIEFPAPPYIAEYAKSMNCPVLFGQSANRLVLKESLISEPGLLSAVAEHQLLRKLCDERMQQVSQHQSWEHRTIRALSGLLTKTSAGMDDVALQLQVPVWTLKRKLQEEGTSFKEVQDKTRRNLAVALLKESGHAISEIAWLTGFSSTEAFSRAFKRWIKLTPGEYRRQIK